MTQFLLNLLDPMENFTNIPILITLQILECPKGTQYNYFFQAGFFPSTVGSVKHSCITYSWRLENVRGILKTSLLKQKENLVCVCVCLEALYSK